MNIKISPSLMCMDLSNLKEQILFFNNHAESLHIDIMDGHFVKNITLSPFFIKGIRDITTIPISSHLMTTNPEDFHHELDKVGSDYICYHVETINGQAYRLIEETKKLNRKVGVVLNPETSFDACKEYAHKIDKITVMTVDPGFAGQNFIEETLPKIEAIAKFKQKHNLSYDIEIDGACNKNTYRRLINAGSEILIVGSSGLFGLDSDLEKAWKLMEENIKNTK